MTIKHELSFDMLVSLMKKNHAVVLCGKDDDIELTLKKDDLPDGLMDALDRINLYWDDL